MHNKALNPVLPGGLFGSICFLCPVAGGRLDKKQAPRIKPFQWPYDAPSPAIAPFDANQVKQHQQIWSMYFGVPEEY